MMTAAAREVGIKRLSGLEELAEWTNSTSRHPEPEAQGPALGSHGEMNAAGPFRLCRHPLNFWGVPILWLSPRMTTNLLAFNVAATVYLYVGSLHEEQRLRAAYGEPYEAYLRSGVPYFVPTPAAIVRAITNGSIKRRHIARHPQTTAPPEAEKCTFWRSR